MWIARWPRSAAGLAVVGLALALQAPTAHATAIPITVGRTVPAELNPPFTNGTGGVLLSEFYTVIICASP